MEPLAATAARLAANAATVSAPLQPDVFLMQRTLGAVLERWQAAQAEIEVLRQREGRARLAAALAAAAWLAESRSRSKEADGVDAKASACTPQVDAGDSGFMSTGASAAHIVTDAARFAADSVAATRAAAVIAAMQPTSPRPGGGSAAGGVNLSRREEELRQAHARIQTLSQWVGRLAKELRGAKSRVAQLESARSAHAGQAAACLLIAADVDPLGDSGGRASSVGDAPLASLDAWAVAIGERLQKDSSARQAVGGLLADVLAPGKAKSVALTAEATVYSGGHEGAAAHPAVHAAAAGESDSAASGASDAGAGVSALAVDGPVLSAAAAVLPRLPPPSSDVAGLGSRCARCASCECARLRSGGAGAADRFSMARMALRDAADAAGPATSGTTSAAAAAAAAVVVAAADGQRIDADTAVSSAASSSAPASASVAAELSVAGGHSFLRDLAGPFAPLAAAYRELLAQQQAALAPGTPTAGASGTTGPASGSSAVTAPLTPSLSCELAALHRAQQAAHSSVAFAAAALRCLGGAPPSASGTGAGAVARVNAVSNVGALLIGSSASAPALAAGIAAGTPVKAAAATRLSGVGAGSGASMLTAQVHAHAVTPVAAAPPGRPPLVPKAPALITTSVGESTPLAASRRASGGGGGSGMAGGLGSGAGNGGFLAADACGARVERRVQHLLSTLASPDAAVEASAPACASTASDASPDPAAAVRLLLCLVADGVSLLCGLQACASNSSTSGAVSEPAVGADAQVRAAGAALTQVQARLRAELAFAANFLGRLLSHIAGEFLLAANVLLRRLAASAQDASSHLTGRLSFNATVSPNGAALQPLAQLLEQLAQSLGQAARTPVWAREMVDATTPAAPGQIPPSSPSSLFSPVPSRRLSSAGSAQAGRFGDSCAALPGCGRCGVGFSLFNRRHHCRCCGQLVCHSCSSHKADMASLGLRQVLPRGESVTDPAGPTRVCDGCHAILALM